MRCWSFAEVWKRIVKSYGNVLQLPNTYLYIIGSKDLENIVSDVLEVVKGPENWLDLRRSMQEQRRLSLWSKLNAEGGDLEGVPQLDP